MENDGIEEARQRAIERYRLGEGREAEFETVTQLACDMFEVPIASITVLMRERQMMQGISGLDVDETPRKIAFCNFTVEESGIFVVEDAREDPRFCNNVAVTGEPHLRFYAGAPIRVKDGVPIGALCLIDSKPRTLSPEDRRRLELLAQTVSDLIELRIGSRISEERERQLQAQTELLYATVNQAQQGVGVFGPEGELVLSNERLFSLLNLDPERFSTWKPCLEELLSIAVNSGALGTEEPEKLAACLLLPEGARYELRGAGGRVLDAWHSAMPDGRTILTVEDTSERRQAVRLKDDFIATVSHELRTPLTAIRGALAVLGFKTGSTLEPQSRQMLEMATRNTERLTSLVNDILDIEKLGSGTAVLILQPIDLRQVLIDACEQNQPYADAHQVKIQLVAEETLPVLGDSRRLIQAVTNLLSNACKFSPPGSTVTVAGLREDGRVKVTVADRGPGIPLEFRQHIFRRFAQADPEHRSGTFGTGLGLAITRTIVDQHNGEIGYDSELGKGTCFWFALPPETTGADDARA
ncbi:GAF domain-containing sensor histidine kinase [Altericroceibacterium xinjiangense]|uniref:GAF domain-containing sensor histidine kinase n=1 Tax=Altericroceibacterium xinjiangense TaxID=762261 RepID=UPI0013DEC715|nr:ATP-binding protein [Altericroceibacterium xinjiangense]